jgi:adenosylhomocysteine nucleosidase
MEGTSGGDQVKSEVRSQKSESCQPLVCFALKEEAGAFQKLAGDQAVSVLITGIGKENSRRALLERLDHSTPKFLLTCGFAGGLTPELGIGAVLFATDDPGLRPRLTAASARPAKFFCASRIATTAVEKAELRRTSGADAVEMESEEIQQVCRERGIPCATVRVISDAAGDDLPLDFNQLSKPDLSLDFGKLALAIAKSPGKIPALLRLQKNSAFAARQLAEVLMQVICPSLTSKA